jgi:hypothetical protein
VRAADRLKALRHPAAAPALATALHGETESSVQVALLSALASLAKVEALPVVKPLLTSGAPEVRIAALKAMITLDASAAAPHLAAATKDPDKAVRRRASLLALGLSGKEALELGTQAIRDADADVRSLAALVLGASNAEVARPLLMEAMRDVDLRVRRAASQSMSKLLGKDVTSLVSLDDAHRRREVRRLATLPAAPVSLSPAGERVGERAKPVVAAAVMKPKPAPAPVVASSPLTPTLSRGERETGARNLPQRETVSRTAVAVLEPVAETPPSPALLTSAMRELRASIRGRQLPELASGIGASTEETMKVCGALMAQGQIVRRGLKYFVA